RGAPPPPARARPRARRPAAARPRARAAAPPPHDPGRRLRYEGADGDLPAEGFAAERERQLPPGRRKRGSAAR
ncbi:DUF4255 domain-containing protein, partial [Streptomyces bacillaris]